MREPSSGAGRQVRPDSRPGVATDGGTERPDWILPAARCGLEVALVVLIAAYLWANVDSQFVQGVVAVFGVVGAVAVFFYYVNQQALAWVRYASAQSRRNQRKRKRERRRSEHQRQRQDTED